MSYLLARKKQALYVTAVALWACLVGSGMNVMWRYSVTPGQAAIPKIGWPVNAPVPFGKARPTLVIFAHPNCPYSRASIGELAILMARSQNKVDAHLLTLSLAAATLVASSLREAGT